MICRNCGNVDAYIGLFGDPECPIVTCSFFSKRRFEEVMNEIKEGLAADEKSVKTLTDDDVTVIKNPYFMNPDWK